jgi:hypothetical protein
MEMTNINNELHPNSKELFATMSPGATKEESISIAEMDNELDHKEPSATTSPGEPYKLTFEKPGSGRIDDEGPKYPQGLKLASIIVSLCLAVFLAALDQTIISTAIPKITDRFHSVDDIGW